MRYWFCFTVLCFTFSVKFSENIQTSNFLSLYEIESKRFTVNPSGVISDSKTGLQWLEGPDIPTSWLMASKWVKSLNNGWRLPTTKELQGIYLEKSKRKGKYGDPLCLDPTFERESGYSLWSTQRSPNSAYIYDFSRGYAHWTEVVVKGNFDRAVAVRRSQPSKSNSN